jgi:hypothetical protein
MYLFLSILLSVILGYLLFVMGPIVGASLPSVLLQAVYLEGFTY